MDLYIILGLERGATTGEIKRAYKRLARRYHPDINPGDQRAAAQFRQIADAYEALSDPDRRRHYDLTGSLGLADAQPAAYGFEGFDFTVSVSGAAASTFGDLFADLREQRDRRREEGGPARGADLHQTISVSFAEAVSGGAQRVTVTRQQHCRACRGTGWLASAETRCAACQGTGSVRSARGHMVFVRTCAPCGGTGRQRQSRCAACAGQQVQMHTEELTVNLPPGLADGARVRVPGKGHAGRDGGEHGDLYIAVRVDPHPLFHREGDDLHVTVPIAVHEAGLGARIDVPSLDGPVRLRVPPGSQSGQRFRVRERGVASPGAAHRGDLVVEVRVVLPGLLDERSKELLREFGRVNSDDVRRGLGK
jgi:molecular chaperone DnaJ